MKTEDWLIGLEKNARVEVLDSIFTAEKKMSYSQVQNKRGGAFIFS